MITAVLPFRSVVDSKRRMESDLSEQERVELSARLLVRTLSALQGARSIERTILVSPDPLARELARAANAVAVDDHGVPLNEAILLGLQHARAVGATTALIIPVDLAHISGGALDELVRQWRTSGAASALLPALDGGTAALITPLPTSMSLHYGKESAALHLRELSATTGSVHRLTSPLAADLDTPEDLAAITPPEAGFAVGDQHDGLVALPIYGLGEIKPNDDLPELIAAAVLRFLDERAIGPLRPDDVISVTQKIVSKAEGAIVDLTTVTPRSEAVAYAERWRRDARQVEVVLQEAVRVVRMDRGVIITETAHGFVLANSGVAGEEGDDLAAAAELALGKSARRPLAFIRGAKPAPTESGSVRESLMPPDWDLFR